MMKKCECGNELAKEEAPNERILFTIFGYEFIVRKWEYVYLDECVDCINDRYNEPYKEIYRQGQQDGYSEAIQEMRY